MDNMKENIQRSFKMNANEKREDKKKTQFNNK